MIALAAFIFVALWRIFVPTTATELRMIQPSYREPDVNPPGLTIKHSVEIQNERATDLGFSPDDKLLAVATREHFEDRPSQLLTQIFRSPMSAEDSVKPLIATIANCGARVVWSSDGNTLFAQSDDPAGIAQIDTMTWKRQNLLEFTGVLKKADELNSLAVDTNGNLFATIRPADDRQAQLHPAYVWWKTSSQSYAMFESIGTTSAGYALSVDATTIGDQVRVAIRHAEGLEILSIQRGTDGRTQVRFRDFDPNIRNAWVGFGQGGRSLVAISDLQLLVFRFDGDKRITVTSEKYAHHDRGDAGRSVAELPFNGAATSVDRTFLAGSPRDWLIEIRRFDDGAPFLQIQRNGPFAITKGATWLALNSRLSRIDFFQVPREPLTLR